MAADMVTVLEAARLLIAQHPRDYAAKIAALPGFAALSQTEQEALRRVPAEAISGFVATVGKRAQNSARAAQVH
jgi:hypothetical protein